MAAHRSDGPEPKAGTISRIRVENFMCHSNMTIDLIDHVNFITGQNGSGKSAILTALCVAFGIKARGTQRATSLKAFVKNGCSSALVVVDLKNEGADAFKPEVYGGTIIIERRIADSGNSFCMKDWQGKKVATKREDLKELIDHFNIDVENPCVIMSQDKSREFLHTGSDKEKFKFFYKATLLQQVNDLLKTIDNSIVQAYGILQEIRDRIKPLQESRKEMEKQLQFLEQVEEMAGQVSVLKKKLAWAFVYEVDHKIEEVLKELEQLDTRIVKIQQKINESKLTYEQKLQTRGEKRAAIADLLQRVEQFRQKQNEIQHEISLATRHKVQLEEELGNFQAIIDRKLERKSLLEQHAREMCDRFAENTQAQEREMEDSLRIIQDRIDGLRRELQILYEKEARLDEEISSIKMDIQRTNKDFDEKQGKRRDMEGYIRRVQNQQSNKVTAFGGEQVLRLLENIEKQHHRFTKPPLGPLGVHVALAGEDSWALAVEVAIGKLLNAFVVTNQKDMLLLRQCAIESGYRFLTIFIYDFEHPLLKVPTGLLPDHLTTVFSVLQTESATVMNILIDQGGVERQVLVKDYDAGKAVAFESRYANLKDVYTMDGLRMFSRSGSQTTLPKDRNIRSGRLGVRLHEQIVRAQRELEEIEQSCAFAQGQKRTAIEKCRGEEDNLMRIKRRRTEMQKELTRQELNLRDTKSSMSIDAEASTQPNTDELEQEVAKILAEIEEKQCYGEKLHVQLGIAQQNCTTAKAQFDKLREAAKDDVEALQAVEKELQSLEDEANTASSNVDHFNQLLNGKFFPSRKAIEEGLEKLREERKTNSWKASQICLEDEVNQLGGVQDNPQKLNTQLKRLLQRIDHDRREIPGEADELRKKLEKIQKKLLREELTCAQFTTKLDIIKEAIQDREAKFKRNTEYLRRQLTWQFNAHLGKKGFSGHVKVDYVSEELSLQVQMPQDNSRTSVNDTRALSGGERSFSTLSFALALHAMTESPFRAMDEFDVFMDAISRKISLDTVVEFALQQGSQWIFITPHDISMVKAIPKVKKQQMAAPRP